MHIYRAYLNKLNPEGKVYGYSQFQAWTEGVAFYTEYEGSRLAAGTSDEYRKEWNSISGRLMLVKNGMGSEESNGVLPLGNG